MDKFCVPGNHGVKFGENRITFDPSPCIKSPLEIHVNAYKWLKTSVMKFNMNVYFINLVEVAVV